MATATLTPTEAEAAELEALAPATAEVRKLVSVYHAAVARKEAAEEARVSARDRLGALLDADGLQGFTVGGKVVARASTVRTPRLDTAKLKAKHPRIFAMFTVVTVSKRITVPN